MKIILLTIAMFVVSTTAASSQYVIPPDSCLKFLNVIDDWSAHIPPERRNPDSVLVDSCMQLDFPWQGFYVKKFFILFFHNNVIPRNYLAPADTIIEYTWEDILAIYPVARTEFETLEVKTGQFYFREVKPSMPDTTVASPSKLLLLRFANHVPFDSIRKELSSMASLSAYSFVNLPSRLDGTSSGVHEERNRILAYPNPTSESITITSDLVLPSTEVRIISADGRVMKTLIYDGAPINVRDLPSGVYMLRIGRYAQLFTVIR